MATQKIRNAANDGWTTLGGGGGLSPVTNDVVIGSRIGADCARENYASGSYGTAFVASAPSP